jgi:hypothetical protein
MIDSLRTGLKFLLMSMGVSSSGPARKAKPVTKPAAKPATDPGKD